MNPDQLKNLFTPEYLQKLFPPHRTDEFFEALLGDAEDGAYDISLGYLGCDRDHLEFELQLNQRPGHCLACNLTQGLPAVLSRHPIINMEGLVKNITETLGDDIRPQTWKLGSTNQKTREFHAIPLTITIA